MPAYLRNPDNENDGSDEEKPETEEVQEVSGKDRVVVEVRVEHCPIL